MNKKLITGGMLFLTICFLLLGIIFKYTADEQSGTSVSVGFKTDNQYTALSSGNIGESSTYESFNTAGTLFYVLAGISGVVCVVSILNRKHK